MSGLCGTVDLDGAESLASLEAMCAASAYRGSPGTKHVEHGELVAALGDNTSIHASDRGFTVVDGRIDNGPELARQLGRDHLESDAALLQAGFESMGASFFGSIDGGFATAIYDRRAQALHLARDMYGSRPLVYARQGGRLWFGSDVGSVVACPSFRRAIDEQRIPHVLAYGTTVGSRVLFRDVAKVQPALACVVPHAGPIRRVPYLGPRTVAKTSTARSEFNEAIWEELVAGMGRSLTDDQTAAVLLSGGIDSSLVAAALLEASPTASALAVTCGYGAPELDLDESDAAREVADHLGLPFENVTTTADDDLLGALRTLVRCMGEPTRFTIGVGLERAMSSLEGRASQLATGFQADLLFGTEEHPDACYVDAVNRWPAPLRAPLMLGAKAANKFAPAKPFVNGYARNDYRSQLDFILDLLLLNRDLGGLVEPSTEPLLDEEDIMAGLARFDGLEPEDTWTATFMMSIGYNWGELLERVAARYGLDLFSPFQTQRMFDLSLLMPGSLKHRDGLLKLCLRDLATERFSDDFARNRKQIFAAPHQMWLGDSPQIRDAVIALGSGDSRVKSVFAPGAVDRLVGAYQRSVVAGTLPRVLADLVFVVLSFELWLDEYFS